MKRYGVFTLASTAAAAALIFAAFLLHPAGTPAVHAKTIFNSFRSTEHRGLRIQCRNLVAEEAAVNAQIIVAFNRPLNLAQLIEQADQDDFSAVDAVYVDAQVELSEANEDAPGLKVAAKVALLENEKWVYVRFDNLPQKLFDEAPFLMFFQNMLRGGLLLDLGNMKEFGPDFWKRIGKNDGDDDDEDDDDDDANNAAAVTVKKNVAAHTRTTGTTTSTRTDQHNLKLNLNLPDDARADDADDAKTEELFKSLLTGRAGRDQLEEIVKMIEDGAKNVSVRSVGDGRHILTASEFEDDDEMLKNATLEIAYREGAGVEWLAVEHVGERNGTIRVEFIDELSPADRLTKQSFLTDGATRVIDASKLAEMFQNLSGLDLGHEQEPAKPQPSKKK